MTKLLVNAVSKANIEEVTAVEECGPIPPSEDFSYYSREGAVVFSMLVQRLKVSHIPIIPTNLISVRILC